MIMTDIETFGKSPDGAIVAIGAVQFDKVNGITKEFYVNVNLESNVKANRKIDAQTVEWWLQQSKEAQQALFAEPRKDLDAALTLLSNFIVEDKAAKEHAIWANGVTFDLVILRSAYESFKMKCPWSYRDEMCLRPIRFLGSLKGLDYSDFIKTMSGTKHNALDDAKVQAQYLLEFMSK